MRGLAVVCLFVFLAGPAAAHVAADHPTLVIDSDAGLDDVVALAMALQHPRIDIAALVAAEGAAGRDAGVENLERLLTVFNRRDIALYAPAPGVERAPPPFRAGAEQNVRLALPDPVEPFHVPFTPDAYLRAGRKTVVLVLGPLSNLAAALRERPEVRDGIEEVIVAGSPDPAESWNAAFDPDALAAVRASGMHVEFVAPDAAAAKPRAWADAVPSLGPGTALGEIFLRRLLAPDEVRCHYVDGLPFFHDELAFLYYTDSGPFRAAGDGVFVPQDSELVTAGIGRLLTSGRQWRRRVVLADRPLPDDSLRDDVRARRSAIIEKNGEEEWFSQLLTNELHEHLGAYSVIGVKMGLRAAELLNAPLSSMSVESEAAAGPPVSCLNDGLLVATGSTPGRGLFVHQPGPAGTVRAVFEYGGRRLTLTLRERYVARIRTGIDALLAEYTLADEEYWQGVRRLGLDIWENWHRLDLFEIEGGS